MNELSKDSRSGIKTELSGNAVVRQPIGEDAAGQRIDNFLVRWLKGVPKSHVYRILRSGEVRVNSGRIGPEYRLQLGDILRIPPIRVAKPQVNRIFPQKAFIPDVIFEDEALLVIDKPSGMAVHGGSGVSFGVIESLRLARPNSPFLELVHRLDRETSGVLLLAKKRSALVAMHQQMQSGQIEKRYFALVNGSWQDRKRVIDLPLVKRVTASGERRVNVGAQGDRAITVVRLERYVGPYSLLDAELKTGRTHQIRVHLAHLGFPILGDEKYGLEELNKNVKKQDLKRMFLHARRIVIKHPLNGNRLEFEAPLPESLQTFMRVAAVRSAS
jgi:23S rRNA pseudouridine955/2504/2580 synthase